MSSVLGERKKYCKQCRDRNWSHTLYLELEPCPLRVTQLKWSGPTDLSYQYRIGVRIGARMASTPPPTGKPPPPRPHFLRAGVTLCTVGWFGPRRLRLAAQDSMAVAGRVSSSQCGPKPGTVQSGRPDVSNPRPPCCIVWCTSTVGNHSALSCRGGRRRRGRAAAKRSSALQFHQRLRQRADERQTDGGRRDTAETA